MLTRVLVLAALASGCVTARTTGARWRAVAVTDEQACFEPINAPSAFCWRRTGDGSAEAVQRWKDQAGREQQYTGPLVRVR